MSEMRVERWIAYRDDISESQESPLGGLGGWFQEGSRCQDYFDTLRSDVRPYAVALRKEIIEKRIMHGGDWHQHSSEGVPLFSDGKVSLFSWRAWGDFLAAVWSTELDRDISYMAFYMGEFTP